MSYLPSVGQPGQSGSWSLSMAWGPNAQASAGVGPDGVAQSEASAGNAYAASDAGSNTPTQQTDNCQNNQQARHHHHNPLERMLMRLLGPLMKGLQAGLGLGRQLTGGGGNNPFGGLGGSPLAGLGSAGGGASAFAGAQSYF